LICALLTAGCRHVTTTGDKSAAPQDEAAKDGGAQTEAAKPASSPSPRNTKGTSASPRSERASAGIGHPQLATSPEGLMVPDGPRLIQEALRKQGYLPDHRSGSFDGPTRGALQRFQGDHGLPGTGAPDRDTLRKLGLDPGKIFTRPGQ
jgi:hypothetical protein